MPSKSKKNQTIIGRLPDGSKCYGNVAFENAYYSRKKTKKNKHVTIVYHGNLLLTKKHTNVRAHNN